MANPNLGDKAILAKALAARKEAYIRRGGISPSMQMTVLVLQEAAARGLKPSVDLLMTATGAGRSTIANQLVKLRQRGFIRSGKYGEYEVVKPLDANDPDVLPKAKHRRAYKSMLARIGGGGPLYGVPTIVLQPQNTELVKAALRALAPFAHYGEKVAGKPGEIVPSLLRKDGLTNAEFQAAAAAYAELDAALKGKEPAVEPPVAEGMDRYFTPGA